MGTGQAIRIARFYMIPVFNLFEMTPEEVLREVEKLNMIQ